MAKFWPRNGGVFGENCVSNGSEHWWRIWPDRRRGYFSKMANIQPRNGRGFGSTDGDLSLKMSEVMAGHFDGEIGAQLILLRDSSRGRLSFAFQNIGKFGILYHKSLHHQLIISKTMEIFRISNKNCKLTSLSGSKFSSEKSISSTRS